MIEFVLNKNLIKTDQPAGSTLLDFIRYHQRLKGTKIGCREGDCGACTLLIGELIEGTIRYKSLTSCITPLGNAQGKHVVTIEGLNMERLTPYQQAMVDMSGSQCGMCTVGFIVSFAGICLSQTPITYERIISAIDGNICRCTGYKSIERAAKIVYDKLQQKPTNNTLEWLVEHRFIPKYFLSIPNLLQDIQVEPSETGHRIIGGGTDLLVQYHDEIHDTAVNLVSGRRDLIGVEMEDDTVYIRAATTTTELLESPVLNNLFPNLWRHLKLVSSTPIRNIATVAGNLINASPIGDLTAFFIALNSTIHLSDHTGRTRQCLLKDLYIGYKQLSMRDDEYVTAISFEKPDAYTHFNFEKVSKRRYLDIATVNTAMQIRVVDNHITDVHIAAGGVGPTPLYLQRSCAYLIGKPLSQEQVSKMLKIVQEEISPISDVRGSENYKRLLLRQLIFAHFVELFPKQFHLASVE